MNDQDISQFIDNWYCDPTGLCQLAGWAIGYSAIEHLNDFAESCGAAFFAAKTIPKRMDFLYDVFNADTKPPHIKMVECAIQNGVVCLKDLDGHHCYVRLMLLRGMGDGMQVYYAIRQFVLPDEQPGPFLSKLWGGPDKPFFDSVFGKSRLVTSPSFFGVGPKLDYVHVFDEDYSFWNFKPADNIKGVIIHPRSEGFFDLKETISVGRLIILASNLFGFKD